MPSEPAIKPKILSAIESDAIRKRSEEDYRALVRRKYDGAAGALTTVSGFFTGHETLSGKLIRPGAFDVTDCQAVLDAGCGNGRYSITVRKNNPDAFIAAFDFSENMIARAHKRLGDYRAGFAAADVTALPYAADSFDAAVCGWVLEHLKDPRPALREFYRVLRPGGRFLLLCTESTWTGAMCSRIWHCRTYRRDELRNYAAECGFEWTREHWFSRMHRALHLGGIIVELTAKS